MAAIHFGNKEGEDDEKCDENDEVMSIFPPVMMVE
jgi:hypothetical protein